MKITDLEELCKLKNEIKQLKKRIQFYEGKESKYEYVADVVKDYSTGYGRNIVITGYSDKASVKTAELENMLIFRLSKVREKIAVIESFIDTIDKSDIRQIIQYRYIDGLPWKVVSKKVYGYPSENRTRMKITRFFEEN